MTPVESDELAGRVALVTGGARGIGGAQAEHLARAGAQVVIADLLDEVGSAHAKAIGPGAAFEHLDVSSENEWESVVAATVARFGRLDILINNAGVSIGIKPLESTTYDDLNLILTVNAFGPYLGMKAAFEELKKSGNSAIVNISSSSGLRGYEGMSSYTASKHAVIGMTRVAAYEWGKHGIRVNSICPGSIQTDMGVDSGLDMEWRTSRIPLGRFGTPSDVAELTLFLVSDRSSFITGGSFAIDGGADASVRTTFAPPPAAR